MKKVYLHMEQGTNFTISAEEIATNRASYYADREDGGQKVFDEELEYTLGDNSELTDWLLNNMNWYDCKTLEITPTPELPYNEREVRDCEVIG